MDLYNRVCGAIERINAEQAGRDVIVVAHGGTIRAAVGACARRSAGERPRLRYRQLLGDAARSSRKRQLHRLAAADGQPAALDRGCLAQRDASAGRPGSRRRRRRNSLDALSCRKPQRLLSSNLKNKTGIAPDQHLGERHDLVRYVGKSCRHHRLDARHRPRHRRAHGGTRRQGRDLLAQAGRLRFRHQGRSTTSSARGRRLRSPRTFPARKTCRTSSTNPTAPSARSTCWSATPRPIPITVRSAAFPTTSSAKSSTTTSSPTTG